MLNILSQFDRSIRVEKGLFRYELWENNAISKVEVENYQVRHYEPSEIEQILNQHGLKVIGKWQTEPYSRIVASDSASVIMYECSKS